MEAATIAEFKKELKHLDAAALREVVLTLARYKKENKELLTYLLFESFDEQAFIDQINTEVDVMFADINTTSYYYMKKSVRKIIRHIRKHIRYSKQPETEAALWQYFLNKMTQMRPTFQKDKVLINIYERQHQAFVKALDKMHPDQRADFEM